MYSIFIQSVQCLHTESSVFIPNVQYFHTECTVSSYRMYSVFIPNKECLHTESSVFIPNVQSSYWMYIIFIPNVQCLHTEYRALHTECSVFIPNVHFFIPNVHSIHTECTLYSYRTQCLRTEYTLSSYCLLPLIIHYESPNASASTYRQHFLSEDFRQTTTTYIYVFFPVEIMLPKWERLSYRKEQSLWMRPSSSGRIVTQRSVLVNDVSTQQIGPNFKRQTVLLVLEYETDKLPKMTVNNNYFAQHPRRQKILFRPRQNHKVILLQFYCFTTKTNKTSTDGHADTCHPQIGDHFYRQLLNERTNQCLLEAKAPTKPITPLLTVLFHLPPPVNLVCECVIEYEIKSMYGR
jgi:hypothetical protein